MKSFVYAFRGIGHAIKTERHVRVHLAAVFYVALTAILYGDSLRYTDWALLALACGLVIGAELFNTAIERLCDGLEPGHSPVVKVVKDLAAGAVLICAIAAVAIAAAVFWYGPSLNREGLTEHPVFWVGIGALPLWGAFIVWFGGKK